MLKNVLCWVFLSKKEKILKKEGKVDYEVNIVSCIENVVIGPNCQIEEKAEIIFCRRISIMDNGMFIKGKTLLVEAF